MAGEIEIAVDNELMCGGNYLLRRIVSYVRLVGDVEILPRFSMGVVVRWRGFAKLAILFQLRPRLVHPNSRIWHYAKRRFPVTSNLRYMYGVLNVDEIKN